MFTSLTNGCEKINNTEENGLKKWKSEIKREKEFTAVFFKDIHDFLRQMRVTRQTKGKRMKEKRERTETLKERRKIN